VGVGSSFARGEGVLFPQTSSTTSPRGRVALYLEAETPDSRGSQKGVEKGEAQPIGFRLSDIGRKKATRGHEPWVIGEKLLGRVGEASPVSLACGPAGLERRG